MGVVIGETAEIGADVTLYQGVTLGGTGFATGKRHPTVQDNVTIGSGAKLLGPITIGHGAKIGANSVVIHDVPPNSTVVGNPGHPVRIEGRRPEGPDADWIHLPDPVADAIRGLSSRIAALEDEPGRSGAEVRPPAGRRGRRCEPEGRANPATAPTLPGAELCGARQRAPAGRGARARRSATSSACASDRTGLIGSARWRGRPRRCRAAVGRRVGPHPGLAVGGDAVVDAGADALLENAAARPSGSAVRTTYRCQAGAARVATGSCTSSLRPDWA